MLAYLARDVRNAQGHTFILGIHVKPRHDVYCPRKGEFCGVFLPDGLPNLYPSDCPDESACCCVLTEFVLDGDASSEAEKLRALRANQPPPRVQLSAAEQTIGASDSEPEATAYSYDEIRVMRNVVKSRKPSIWDAQGLLHSTLGYDPALLLSRMVAAGWVTHATLEERLAKFTTVDRLKALCGELGLPRGGDKQMLMQRVIDADAQKALALTGTQIYVRPTDRGWAAITALDGQAHIRQLEQDGDMRSRGYQRLVTYANGIPGAAIIVEGNPWSSCPKLAEIAGRYTPADAPWLPPGDCPQAGVRPCTCWSATYEAPAQPADTPAQPVPVPVPTVIDVVAKPVRAKAMKVGWIVPISLGMLVLALSTCVN